MKTWSSIITYSVFDMGRECETEEEYIEWVKETFREEHNIELRDDEITEIEFEEVENENL
jgi:lipoate-protein ligase A